VKPAVVKASIEAVVDGRKVRIERTYSFDVLNESAADDVVHDLFSEIEWGYEISPSPLAGDPPAGDATK